MRLRGRRLFTVGLAAGLVLGAPGAVLAESGSVLIGNPATWVIGGVSEIAAACDPDSGLNGIDGVWFAIPTGSTSATINPEVTLDADGWYYTASCDLIDNSSLVQTGLGEDEQGTIPAGASFLVVDGALGTGDFELTFG